MKKFLAVVKHEYKKIVLKWTFLVATLLFPLIALGFAVVPALIFSIKGDATRIVVVDQKGKVAPRIKDNLLREEKAEKNEQAEDEALKNLTATQKQQMERAAKQMEESFVFVDYKAADKSIEQIKRELNAKITGKEIDAYLIVPPDYDSKDANYEFFTRKADGLMSKSIVRNAINGAVRSQKLADANINEAQLNSFNQNVELSVKQISEEGNEKDSDGTIIAAFVVGLMIYITLLIYGQQIMAAVIEEKETRIAEILFSSAKPFELMMGKLVGVGLAGITQLAIWITSALVLVAVGAATYSIAAMNISFPDISPLTIIYFFIFFILGFFIYATIYALIGSMVTTVQEGGQFAMIPVFTLVAGLYLSFAIIQNPSSKLAFWASIAPFVAPLTMPVRILAETPPFWQIALAIALNGAAIAGLVWLAARVYRVGMLMYGKKATIPEVWKWIRQA